MSLLALVVRRFCIDGRSLQTIQIFTQNLSNLTLYIDMTCYQDLEKIDYFPVTEDIPLYAVGWIDHQSEFPQGEVTRHFFDKLCELAENSWEPVVSAGFHSCEICQFHDYQHTARGSKNLFIPFNNAVYVAPELIVHYINEHHYLPPKVFIDGVMQCPNMQSMNYKKLLLKNGGRGLIKLAKP